MSPLELLQKNLLSPMVLCFGLGAMAKALKSDLRLPESVYTVLSTYLMLAIGMKGGAALAQSSPGEVLFPAVATALIGAAIPLAVFFVCRSLGRLDPINSAALGAHYGSVSAVTFIASLNYLELAGQRPEGFMPALVAIMEIPGIVVALMLARKSMPDPKGLKAAFHEIVTGRSILLMGGGLLIGALSGAQGYEQVKPFFVAPFQGALCLFMLDMGMLAAGRLSEARQAGWFVVGLALLAPLVLGAVGVSAGLAMGLSSAGATVLGVLCGSASYIAAPAAVRQALPEANPGIYLTAAIGITFPFNLSLGIPLLHALAQFIAGR